MFDLLYSETFQRKDPEEFMQIHGQRMPIHMDASYADSISKLFYLNIIIKFNAKFRRKWQGDPNILIDRFDVRVHLETIPDVQKQPLHKPYHWSFTVLC